LFIVSINYTAPLEKIDQYIPVHIEFLDEQYRLGHFQLSGRKVPRTGGIIIATVKKRAELDRILQKDPFFRHRLADYEITEIAPTRSSPALAFLVE
jgi:uncharacterized protein YciI